MKGSAASTPEARVLLLSPENLEWTRAADALAAAGLPLQRCVDAEQIVRELSRGAAVAVVDPAWLDRKGRQLLVTAFKGRAAGDLPRIILANLPGRKNRPLRSLNALLKDAFWLEQPIEPSALVAAVRVVFHTQRRQTQRRTRTPRPADASANAVQALELRVQELLAQLKETSEQMDAFTYSVSHDLRAPLRAIRGFAQALVEDYGRLLDTTGRDYLKRMEEGAERLDLLIQDVLQLSRLGRSQISFGPVELDACLDRALQPLQDQILAANARIEIHQPLPVVVAHDPTLQQVLRQLVSNAVKFVEPSVQPHVRIWSTPSGGNVRLWIADNGIGIAPAYHQRIFGVFERLHSTDAYPGTGIGLAIVSKAMARLGGRVGLASAPKTGSQFWIELPAAIQNGDNTPTSASPGSQTA
jgi:signal transduction histidine kinase